MIDKKLQLRAAILIKSLIQDDREEQAEDVRVLLNAYESTALELEELNKLVGAN
jgi:tRNA A-37 threonylcarbamoyl transferase component Bud32